MSNVDVILKEGLAALDTVADLVELEQVKARYLGKSGALTELLKQLGKLSPDERKSAGATINAAKQAFEIHTGQRGDRLASAVTWQDLVDLGLIDAEDVP